MGTNSLGIELGSTRIKAVLVDSDKKVLQVSSFGWENQFVDGFWTYDLADVWKGIKSVMNDFKDYKIDSMGVSAMMHGYLAFDENDNLLVPFRTWRNSTTQAASDILTKEFNFNIPKRYSIAHLYQAILNNEEHISKVAYITTLAGYVHWQLTGEKVLGIGDASGVFPTNQQTKKYDSTMLQKFDQLTNIDLSQLLPKILLAGNNAGKLTEKGAELLGISENVENFANIIFCPPEGDAGTGMVATNSIKKATGNISAGTSAFAMIVLEKPLTNLYPEIDIVTTPMGEYVAMIHTNNCTSEINAWMSLFGEIAQAIGILRIDKDYLFERMFARAERGDSDCGGLLSYGFVSGESIANVTNGVPLFMRKPGSKFNLANFMKANIYGAFAALYMGMKILQKENIKIDSLIAHGGIFKSGELPQKVLAAAMQSPITTTTTASEGGAYGIALLAAFLFEQTKTLEEFLDSNESENTTITPTAEEIEDYKNFMDDYIKMLEVERKADSLC
ncbi:MAG: FGGY-family carbohydrate kinase [Firmicutes bacterium]|nr:FGGY-family carbohydrate kinase [Bacillota bacterium]